MRKFTCEDTAEAVKRTIYSVMEEVVDGESLYVRSYWGKRVDAAFDLHKKVDFLEGVW